MNSSNRLRKWFIIVGVVIVAAALGYYIYNYVQERRLQNEINNLPQKQILTTDDPDLNFDTNN